MLLYCKNSQATISKYNKTTKKLRIVKQDKEEEENNWSISIGMPELKCFSIMCHIPELGLRKGSSALPPALPTPQAIKTCTHKKSEDLSNS